MERLLCCLLAPLFFVTAAYSQTMCFWTNDQNSVPIRIYVDEQYIGDVTQAFDNEPMLDQPGCLSVDTTPAKHMLTAVNRYGQIYSGWFGSIRPRVDRVNFIHIYPGCFHSVVQSDPRFSFIDWGLFIYSPGPPPYHDFFHDSSDDNDVNPNDDKALLITMAVAAVAGTAAMAAAAGRNWSYPDNRFPYYSAGLGTEYLFGLASWRNVATIRARFGNFGGLSLLGDFGWSTTNSFHNYSSYSGGTYSSKTWSVGIGFDYGGFCFAFKYKAPTSSSLDTFLTASAIYDWWFAKNFGVNFHAGFGVSGFGYDSLLERFEFPVGIGLSAKF